MQSGSFAYGVRVDRYRVLVLSGHDAHRNAERSLSPGTHPMHKTLTLAAVAMVTTGCAAMRAMDPQIPPLSEREPAFLAYCRTLKPDRRCDPGGGRCLGVLDRHGREVAAWDSDQEWQARDLRASCEMYERDKADPCLLEIELIRSKIRLVPSEKPMVNGRGSFYTLGEASELCEQHKARAARPNE